MSPRKRVLDPRIALIGIKQDDLLGRFIQCRRHAIVAARLRSAGITGMPHRVLSLDDDGDPERREYLTELGLIADVTVPSKTITRDKIRARRFWGRLTSGSVIDAKHLHETERIALRRAAKEGAKVAGRISADDADEIVAGLHAEAPWLRELHADVLLSLRESAKTGAGFHMPPAVLVGPPGTGKSAALRRLASALRVPCVPIDASSGGHFALTGTERGWGSAHAGAVSQAVIGGLCYNPIVIIDELEKASGAGETTKGSVIPGMQSSILPLLEPTSARAWRCPYYGVPIDATGVTYLMTANSMDGISDALRSRLRVYHVDHLSADHLALAARKQGQEAGLDEDVWAAIEGLVREMRRRRPVHLREVRAIVERMQKLESSHPLLH